MSKRTTITAPVGAAVRENHSPPGSEPTVAPERAAPEKISPPKAVEADDIRTAIVEVPTLAGGQMYPVRELMIHRPHANILARVTNALIRQGARLFSGKLVENPNEAMEWLCEQIEPGRFEK